MSDLPSEFDTQPELSGFGLSLRGLVEGDRVALRQAASDAQIWAGHPARDRYLPDVFDPYFDMLLASGSTLLITESESGRVIGCSRFYGAPNAPGDVSIGFTFLTRDHWGGRTNFALKRLMLDHVFRDQQCVWFHIDPVNIRSQTATGRLGAKHVETVQRDLGAGPADWFCYRLDREDWAALVTARADSLGGGEKL